MVAVVSADVFLEWFEDMMAVGAQAQVCDESTVVADARVAPVR